jgi:hypothetical protein
MPMAMELTPIELKLLRLVLDKGAAPGEIENCALMLIRSLRKRGVSAQEIEEALAGTDGEQAPPPRMSRPDYGLCRMPFGKTKGQLFMDLPPYDLRSAKRWAMSTPDLA